MNGWSSAHVGLLLFVVALVAVPAGALGSASVPAPGSRLASGVGAAASPRLVAPTDPSSQRAAGSAAGYLAAADATLKERGVPASDIHPPNLFAESPGRRGQVQPTYSQGPAPMGISDLGLRNVSGSLVPYEYNSSSVWGTVTFDRAQTAYVDGDGPDTFGVQLNAVATNVTILGVPGYEFWTQDFVSYTSSTGSLTFGDNVWNFSGPFAPFPLDVLYAYGPNGQPEPPYYYYAVGPTLQVTYPFTLNLFLNSSAIDGRPAVYFNYSVTAGVTTHAGSFDDVVFNSIAGPGHGGASAPVLPAFQVNGTGLDPTGLPNDFELVLVGNDDGDTTTFFAINATMALRFLNGTTHAYQSVPAAFDAGSDTGETSNGVLPTYSLPATPGPPTVTLRVGPSFVEGLWNVSNDLDGSRAFVVAQSPQNAFLFVSPGATFNASEAQWVPTIRLFGATRSNFSVPNNVEETFEWMLSDRVPATYAVTPLLPLSDSTTAITEALAVNATWGSYTPLLAWGDAELNAIKQGTGNGTPGNPYVLIHHPLSGGLDPVFGQLNDFGFPVFAGVLLIDTNYSVEVVQPAVSLTYGPWEAPLLANISLPNYTLPSSNALQLEFWNVTNLVVLNSTELSGWLTSNFDFYPVGEVVFWGSSHDLVARDTFYDQGVAIALYGGNNVTIWGNTFLQGSVEPSFDFGTNVTGILEAESNDTIYNNYFDVPQPAVTPTVDLASCQIVCLEAAYTDAWNVPEAPANASTMLLGVLLTGSIVRTWYQGGNYWWNYGSPADPFGVLPYNNGGEITNGGDYVPLVVSTVYAVTFAETGLPAGTPWSVTALGVTSPTTAATVVVEAPNGSYAYAIGTPSGFEGPSGGVFAVAGANLSVSIAFEELFTVTVVETGLVAGWTWTTFVNTTSSNPSTLATIVSGTADAVVALPNGSYAATFAATGFAAVPVRAPVTVAGKATVVDVTFSPMPVLTVTALELPAGASWWVTVSEPSGSVSKTAVGDGSIVFTVLQIQPGSFTWAVIASGYLPTPAGGSGSSPTEVATSVTFAPAPATSSGNASPDWTLYALIAAAALAVAGFVLYASERRRRGGAPPKPLVAAQPPAGAAGAAVAPAAPAAPAGPAPWEEGPADAERPPAFGRGG